MKKQNETAAGRAYARQLRGVARVVATMISTFTARVGTPEEQLRRAAELSAALQAYGDAIAPWSRRVAANMLAGLERGARKEEALRKDIEAFVTGKQWRQRSEAISEGLQEEFESGEAGKAARELIAKQVDLITGIPRNTAEKIQKWAREAHVSGYRDEWLVKKIMAESDMTKERATLIARTEISRSQAVLERMRNVKDGITHYIWSTSGDEDVRPEHAKLEGKKFRYDSPPFIPGEGNHHPGEFPNCRCIAYPVIDLKVLRGATQDAKPKKTAAQKKLEAAGKRALRKAAKNILKPF